MITKVILDKNITHVNSVDLLRVFIKAALIQGWNKKQLDDLVILATSGDSAFLIETLHNYISDE